MKITIDSETAFWTNIEVHDANDELVFDGALKLEPDWWTLRVRHNGVYDTVLKRWAGRRKHLDVLADALKLIAKLP